MTTLTEQIPVPMSRLVLINYQQSPCPAAADREHEKKGRQHKIQYNMSNANAAAINITKWHVFIMYMFVLCNIYVCIMLHIFHSLCRTTDGK